MVIYKSKKNNKIKISKIKGGKPHQHDSSFMLISDLLKDIPFTDYIAFHQELPLFAILHENRVQIWQIHIENSSVNFMHNIDTPVSYIDEAEIFVFHPTKPDIAINNEGKLKLYTNIDNLDTIQCFATINITYRTESPWHDTILTFVKYHRTLPIIAIASEIRPSTTNLSDDFDIINIPISGSTEIYSFTPSGSTTLVTQITKSYNFVYRHRVGTASAPVSQMDFHHELPIIGIVNSNYIHIYTINIVEPGNHQIMRTPGKYVSFHKNLNIFFTFSSGEYDEIAIWHLPKDLSNITSITKHTFLRDTITQIALHPSKLILVVEQTIDRLQPFLRQLIAFSFFENNIKLEGKSHIYDLIQPNHNYLILHSKLPIICNWNRSSIKLWLCIKPYNDFNLFSKKGDISEDICNSLCYLCNFNLCMKNPSNDKNSNGYVVNLTNGDPTNDKHFHYNCLHFQLITNKTEIDNIPISSDTIQRILNIDDKMDALIGTDFHN
jgi:hypothetical protein